jgi:hypothetical protein
MPLALLLLALASGVAAGRDHGVLSSPGVSPHRAAVGAPVTFTVTYTEDLGVAPQSVAAVIDSTKVPLKGASTKYRTGVNFSGSTASIPAGHHSVVFVATDHMGGQVKVSGGYLDVVPPATPTPKPVSTPLPTPTPGSGGDSGNLGPIAGGSPSTSGDDAGASVEPSASPQAQDPAAGSEQGSSSNSVGRIAVEIHDGMAPGVEPARVDPLFAYRHAPLPTLLTELTPTIATVATGGAAWAAFVIFGKRRRDEDGNNHDPQLALAAASAMDTAAAPGLDPSDESLMPRWRRPSLQKARKIDPLRITAEAPVLSFDDAGIKPLDRYERRRIRYRLVRLLDSPDEVRAAEIGLLDRGDEVQLIERYGVYWRVLCPDGRTGWVHRMTLSDIVDGAAVATEAAEADPTVPFEMPGLDLLEQAAPEPEQVDAFEAEPAEPQSVDGLLEAYLRARGEVQFEPEQEAELEVLPFALAAVVEPEIGEASSDTIMFARRLERLGLQPFELGEESTTSDYEVQPSETEDAVEADGSAPDVVILDVEARLRTFFEPAGHASHVDEPAQPAAFQAPEPEIEPEIESEIESDIEPQVERQVALETEIDEEPVVDSSFGRFGSGDRGPQSVIRPFRQFDLAPQAGDVLEPSQTGLPHWMGASPQAEPAVARALDYLQRAGFAVRSSEPNRPAIEPVAEPAPVEPDEDDDQAANEG